MFKDSLPSYQLPQPNDLSVPPKHEVEQIVSFIDNHIADFPHYYNQNKDSVRENWISNLLVRHFNLCNCENGGYLPYENPATSKLYKRNGYRCIYQYQKFKGYSDNGV